MDDAKLLLRVAEASERTNISRTRLFELMGSGELESVLVGRRRLIPQAALVAFVDRLRAEAAAAHGGERVAI